MSKIYGGAGRQFMANAGNDGRLSEVQIKD